MCVQENNFKVKQIQYKGKGEVCHLGVISFEEKIKYVYIYDLGLKKKSFKEFYDKYLKYITKIDRIYLSHFCDDHIRGLNAIKQYDTGEKFKDVEYWLPYINEIDKYLQFLFIEEWSEKEYIEFIRNAEWFNNGQEGNPNRIFPTFGRNCRNNGNIDVALDSMDNSFDSAHICFKVFKNEIWQLKPYVFKRSKDEEKIIAEINKNIKTQELLKACDEKQDNEILYKLLRDWKKAIKKYKVFSVKTGDKNQSNLISASLYSGPKISKDCFRACYCSLSYYNYSNGTKFYYCSPCAWMHTGDANLKDEARRNDFNLYYADERDYIGVFTLPHHGSMNNSIIDLVPDNVQHVVITPNSNVTKVINEEELKKIKKVSIHVTENENFILETNALAHRNAEVLYYDTIISK